MDGAGGNSTGWGGSDNLDSAICTGLMEAMLKATDEGVLVFDSDGRIVAVNERAHLLSGCEKDYEAIPANVDYAHLAEVFELLTPDGQMLQLEEGPMARVLRGETVHQLHLRIRRRDTGASWIGVFNGLPVFSNDGRVAMGVLAMRDFTNRTETEHALVETNMRLTELLESIADAFISYDSQWRYVYINEPAAKILGRSRHEVIGKVVWEFVPEDVAAPFHSGFNLCMQSRQPVEFEAEFKPKGLCLLCRCFPTRDGGVSTYFIDITQRREAEKALRESESRFRTMADNIPQLAWMADESGNIFWYNERWSEFTGLPLADMQQGEGWRKVHHPDHVERVLRKLAHSFETGAPLEDYFPLQSKDGGYRWYIFQAKPIRSDEGRIVRWFGTYTDVTEQRRTQEALAASEQRLRLSQQVARVGTFEWNLQDNHLVWSPEMEALYGLTPGEFEGTPEAWIERVYPQDRALAQRSIDDAMESGSLKGEWRVIRPDGAVRWLEARGWVFKDAGGRPRQMLGVNLEITARKNAEEEVKRLTEHRRLALEFGQTGTWEYNYSKQEVYCDDLACRMLGVAKESINYAELRNLVHPDDRPLLDSAFETAMNPTGNGGYEVEHRVIQPDGQVRWLLSRGRVIFMERGDKRIPERLVGTLVDVTDRRQWTERLQQMTAELRRSNEELEQFAYVASHDLQEPLRMVTSFVQLLGDRYKDKLDSRANQYISFAVDGAGRMRQLIDDLLSYSRVERRGRELIPTSSQVAFETALANLLSTIEQTNAEITHDALPTVKGDNWQLVQLFQNLVSNGLKFHRPDVAPQIHVGAERDGGQWRFSVRDNGIGIPENQRDRLFVIFQRLHTSSEYPGTGVGLAICRKIVERHGGNIWLESAPGEGTTFYFTLPAVEDVDESG